MKWNEKRIKKTIKSLNGFVLNRENYQISTEALGGLYVCSLSLNYIVLISSPYESEDPFYEFIRFSCSFISRTINSPIKNITKQNPNPAPVYPLPFPYTIKLKIEPKISLKSTEHESAEITHCEQKSHCCPFAHWKSQFAAQFKHDWHQWYQEKWVEGWYQTH